MSSVLLDVTVVACLAFAALNGMNDLSALSATLVSTRAMNSRAAPLLAVCGLWLGIVLGSDAVSRTVALDLVSVSASPLAQSVWLGSVVAALAWGALARRLGIPTSATHAYVGALCGAALLATGDVHAVHWGWSELMSGGPVVGVVKVFVALMLSPLAGAGAGYLLYTALAGLARRAPAPTATVHLLEGATVLVQCASYGFSDAHGAMGLLVGALMASSSGLLFGVPLWVKGACGVALSLGAAAGSVRISRMMSRGLISVQPVEALSAQLAATGAVVLAAMAGAPVSSTQVASSALVGVGGAWRPRHVRWAKVREILLTWVVTFPCALAAGALLTTLLCHLR